MKITCFFKKKIFVKYVQTWAKKYIINSQIFFFSPFPPFLRAWLGFILTLWNVSRELVVFQLTIPDLFCRGGGHI